MNNLLNYNVVSLNEIYQKLTTEASTAVLIVVIFSAVVALVKGGIKALVVVLFFGSLVYMFVKGPDVVLDNIGSLWRMIFS